MTTFSIVIPTLARADTLRHALHTTLVQTDPDVEIIVHESGADPDTAALLAEIADPRVRFYSTGEPVTMTENWERALSHVSGDYIFFLGDDDGILPDACAIAREFFASQSVDVLSWRPGTYYWPRFVRPDLSNCLFAFSSTELACTIKDARALLHLIYRFRESFARLPMIYNSFVSRKLIERVREERGRYFFGNAPDVISGIVNCHYGKKFGLCSRPLAMVGVSHHSVGYRFSLSGDLEQRRQALTAAFGNRIVHPTMMLSTHLAFVNANEYLLAKDALFPDDPPELCYTDMLRDAAQTINAVPAWYDEIKSEIHAIGAKNGVALETIAIPPQLLAAPEPVRTSSASVSEISSGITSVNVNGDVVGINNVFDAASYLHAHLPGFARPLAVATEFDQHRPISLSDGHSAVIDFSLRGDAIHVLGPGWSEIEYWGVWSLGPEAELTLQFAPSIAGTLRIRIEARAAVSAANPAITITVRSGAHMLGRRVVDVADPRADMDLEPIDVAALGDARRLHLTFTIDTPLSPARAGTGADIREIGFGPERIVISAQNGGRKH